MRACNMIAGGNSTCPRRAKPGRLTVRGAAGSTSASHRPRQVHRARTWLTSVTGALVHLATGTHLVQSEDMQLVKLLGTRLRS
jgi:hypothetical protein